MSKSRRLTNLRNLKLIDRYFYWTEIKRRRFDDVLFTLSEEEFFIEEDTIEGIIKQDCYSEILNKKIEEYKKHTKNQCKLFN